MAEIVAGSCPGCECSSGWVEMLVSDLVVDDEAGWDLFGSEEQ